MEFQILVSAALAAGWITLFKRLRAGSVTSRQSDVIALVLIVASYLFGLGFWMFLFLGAYWLFEHLRRPNQPAAQSQEQRPRQLSPGRLTSLARLTLPASRVSGGRTLRLLPEDPP